MSRFNIDYESRSQADLKTTGAFRYASDPSAAILLAAICKEDGLVLIWDAFASPSQNAPALALLREAASDPANTIYAFNAPFEVAVTHFLWEKTFGFAAPALTQWRCSAALCRIAAIPASLEKAAEFLNLPIKKDKAGSALIRAFCVPQKDGTFLTPSHPGLLTVAGEKVTSAQAWSRFRSYCTMDVETERAMGQRLASLELTGWVLQSFQLDLKMNVLGVPINLQAVANAQEIVDQYTERMTARFRGITGLNPGQQAKVLKWMQDRGYPGANLQVGTVGDILEEEDTLPDTGGMTPEASEALRIKVMVGFAALKKLPTMKRAACADGRIRGMFKWYGAARTGRYSSGIVQLQNLKRSTALSEECYRYIRDGGQCADSVEVLFGSPLVTISTAIRHFIDPGHGQQFLDCDLAQIEGRVLAWLAGHEDLLQTFREGLDLYKATIAPVLGIAYEDVTKAQRTVAKALTLACGYAGGLNAMNAACKMYGMEMADKEKRFLIKMWRKANKPITDFWKAVGDAAIEAIRNPATWVRVSRNIRIGVTGVLGYREMVIELPSKRKLHYPYPEIREMFKIKRPRVITEDEVLEEDDDGKEWVEIPRHQAVDAAGNIYDGVWMTYEVSYYGQIKGSVSWGRIRTHSGVLVENITQAVAGDFLNHGALCADKAGYDVSMTVHDQLVCYYHPERGNTVDGLVEALCTLPDWAPGMPLDAVGSLTEFLTKD